jgi:cupin fold WbuC family metalloprotein
VVKTAAVILMRIFSANSLDALSEVALVSQRRRMNFNIHGSYLDSCQRFFNAIEPESYIRPHRHLSDDRDELLIAVRGIMALVVFDDVGSPAQVVRFGSEKYKESLAVGVEVSSSTWHTVVSLVTGSILLEVKAGPFDPHKSKDKALWAPDECSPAAPSYQKWLISLAAA